MCLVGRSEYRFLGLRRQSHHSGNQLVVEAIEGFAETDGEEGLGGLGAEKVGVGVDAGGQEFEHVVGMTESKETTHTQALAEENSTEAAVRWCEMEDCLICQFRLVWFL